MSHDDGRTAKRRATNRIVPAKLRIVRTTGRRHGGRFRRYAGGGPP